MSIRHPSRSMLRAWLNSEDAAGADSKLDRHIELCDRCANALEEIESAELVESSSIEMALTEVLAAPADLAERLETGVAARLSSRQIFEIVGDLFGAGLETTRLILTEEADDDN